MLTSSSFIQTIPIHHRVGLAPDAVVHCAFIAFLLKLPTTLVKPSDLWRRLSGGQTSSDAPAMTGEFQVGKFIQRAGLTNDSNFRLKARGPVAGARVGNPAAP